MNKVFLIGDSIRMGYDRYVRDHLSGRAEVYYPTENCRFSGYVLRYAKEWIAKECPLEDVSVVHFNCGLWDVLHLEGDGPQTPLAAYEENMRRIVKRLRLVCPNAKLVFATSTPIQPERYNDPAHFFRYNSEIEQYNESACRIMGEQHVAVNDLYAAAAKLPAESWSDATHLYTPLGTRTLGDAVVASIEPLLT